MTSRLLPLLGVFSLIGTQWLTSPSFESPLPLFVSYRIELVHLIASLPLAFLVARFSPQILPFDRYGFVISITFSVVSVLAFGPLSYVLRHMEAGFWTRWSIRSIVAFCLTANWLSRSSLPMSFQSNSNTHHQDWVWTILVWLTVPAIFGVQQWNVQKGIAVNETESSRLMQAYLSTSRLEELDGKSLIRGSVPANWRRRLSRQINETAKQVELPLLEKPSIHDLLQRCMQLLSLSLFDDADQILSQLPITNLEVRTLLAIIAREKNDWTRVESLCSKLVSNELSEGRHVDSLFFELLGEALVQNDKKSEAILCFERAAVHNPANRAEFEMRLGSLYSEIGESERAIEYFRLSAKSDPNRETQSIREVRKVQNNHCRIHAWKKLARTD